MFKNKAARYNKGKLQTSLVPVEWIIEIAKVFHQGAKKYAPHNWLKGMSYADCLAAHDRHILKWRGGERNDPETGCHHLVHAAWNLLAIFSYQIRGKDKEFNDLSPQDEGIDVAKLMEIPDLKEVA